MCEKVLLCSFIQSVIVVKYAILKLMQMFINTTRGLKCIVLHLEQMYVNIVFRNCVKDCIKKCVCKTGLARLKNIVLKQIS